MDCYDRSMTKWKSDRSDKIEILPSCSHVNTIVWLHHWDFNKMPGEKASWESYRDTACSFEQILKAAPHKATTVQPLTSHLTNHPNKTSKTGWALLKSKETQKQHSSMNSWT